MPDARLERTRRAYDEGQTMLCAVGPVDQPELWILQRVPSLPPFLMRAMDEIDAAPLDLRARDDA